MQPVGYNQDTRTDDSTDIIPGYLPANDVWVLAAPSGAGKTAFLACMIRSLLHASSFLGMPIQHRPPWIGVISADRGWSDHHKWYKLEGIADIPHYSMIDDLRYHYESRFMEKDKRKIVNSCIDHLKAPRGGMVVSDTGGPYIGDIIKYDSVAANLGMLNQVAIERGISKGLVLHAKRPHTGPEQNLRKSDRVAGSIAIRGYTGTIITLSCVEEHEDGIQEVVISPHHQREQSWRIPRDKEGRWRLDDAIPTSPTVNVAGKVSELSDSAAIVYSCVPDAPSTIYGTKVAEALTGSIGKSQVYNILNDLAKKKLIVKGDEGWQRVEAKES